MEAHQDRVVYEKKELDDKINKLYTFSMGGVFIGLSEAEQERLLRQLKIMHQYSEVLGERIANF